MLPETNALKYSLFLYYFSYSSMGSSSYNLTPTIEQTDSFHYYKYIQ